MPFKKIQCANGQACPLISRGQTIESCPCVEECHKHGNAPGMFKDGRTKFKINVLPQETGDFKIIVFGYRKKNRVFTTSNHTIIKLYLSDDEPRHKRGYNLIIKEMRATLNLNVKK